MHIAWVVPNAHPNHRGWLAGLNQRGHRSSIEAVRLVGTKVSSWDRSLDVAIRPIGESPVSALIRRWFRHRRDKGRRWFFPPYRGYLRSLDELAADVFVVRPQSIPLLTIVAFHCRRRRIPLLVYEQHDPRPLRQWRESRLSSEDRAQAVYGSLRLRLLGRIFGDGVMSPVLHSDIDVGHSCESFIPFPATPLTGAGRGAGPAPEQVWPSGPVLKVLVVARFIPRKHHLLLIETIEALRDAGDDVAVVIVGQAAGRNEKALLRTIRERVDASPHRRAIAVLANLSSEGSLSRLHEHADVLVLPAEREPASVAVVEAIGHGLPVVVSSSCGTAGYVEHERTGLHIEAGSQESLQQALARLARDRHELSRMAAAAAARRDTILSTDIVARRLENRLLRAIERCR